MAKATLSEYSAKRRFDATPRRRPRCRSWHYELRLECGGVFSRFIALENRLMTSDILLI